MLTFRPLQWQDAAPLYVWRHDEQTVKWSIKPPPTWDEHLAYLNEIISSSHLGKVIWIGQDGIPSPVVCVEVKEQEVSINTNPWRRHEGAATAALKYVQLYYNIPLKATILSGNEASIRLFKKCGFKEYTTVGDMTIMEWTP